MNAIRIDRLGGPEVLLPVTVDVPSLAADELHIRHTAIGINYIDVYVRTGIYKRDLPLIPGREGAGVVEAVGTEVTGFSVGDRVAFCDAPKLGGYAERSCVPARFVVPIPEGVPDDIACALMVQGLTAHYLVNDTFTISPGDRVLVHAAAGGAGRLVVQLAKRAGATVFATAGGADKVELARSAGADHAIDYRATDFAAAVLAITGGAKLDAVYDSVGLTTWEASLSLIRPRGTFVLYGAASGPVPPIDPQRLSQAGSLYFTRPTLVHYVQSHGELMARTTDLFDAYRAGELDVRIGAHYALADAAQAHRDLEARKTTGKLVLTP